MDSPHGRMSTTTLFPPPSAWGNGWMTSRFSGVLVVLISPWANSKIGCGAVARRQAEPELLRGIRGAVDRRHADASVLSRHRHVKGPVRRRAAGLAAYSSTARRMRFSFRPSLSFISSSRRESLARWASIATRGELIRPELVGLPATPGEVGDDGAFLPSVPRRFRQRRCRRSSGRPIQP